MDRRGFFNFGLKRSKDTMTEALKLGLEATLKRTVIRPPGALDEDQFLLTCTRCDDCVAACPHDAIHLVDSVRAGLLNRTPFVDPYFKACQYCSDMPCITACKVNALKAPSSNSSELKMGVAEVDLEHCLIAQGQRCDYCYGTCPEGVDAISRGKNAEPVINADTCVGCGKCAYICVSQTGKAIVVRPV